MILKTLDSLNNVKYLYSERNHVFTSKKEQAEFFHDAKRCNAVISRFKSLGYKYKFVIEDCNK